MQHSVRAPSRWHWLPPSASRGAVQAFEIDTGNEDIAMRWDNTIRYNAGLRAQKQNPRSWPTRTSMTMRP
jgi:hypothetical protein